jgi:hypothetical protein
MRKLGFAFLLLLALVAVFALGVVLGPLAQNMLGLVGPRQLNATVILDRVQQLSTLTTARYNFSTIVTSQREMPAALQLLYGERLALVAVGQVTAGVDLAALTGADITFQGGVLRLSLPAASLQDCFLDENASYVIERDTGLFNRGVIDLESTARQYAVAQFREFALNEGILATAESQARAAIQQVIVLAGLEQVSTVEVTFKAADPAAPLPASCLG